MPFLPLCECDLQAFSSCLMCDMKAVTFEDFVNFLVHVLPISLAATLHQLLGIIMHYIYIVVGRR